MTTKRQSRIAEILRKHEPDLLTEWMRQQQVSIARRRDLISDRELEAQSREFLGLFRAATQAGSSGDPAREPEWAAVRDRLAGVSRSRSLQGFSPAETAGFVFSLKEPLFIRIGDELGRDAAALFEELHLAGDLPRRS